jgi:hypothetical protein
MISKFNNDIDKIKVFKNYLFDTSWFKLFKINLNSIYFLIYK